MICNAYDNKGILTTRYVVEGTRYWQIDNCDFIISNGKPLCSNVNTGVNVGTYVFNNSRVFGNGNLLGREGNVLSDFSVTLNSTSFYGTHKINPGSFSVDVTENEATVTKTFNTYVYFYGTGTVTSVSESGCILPDGHIIIPTVGIGTTSIFPAPAYARYSNLLQDDIQYLGGNYTSAGYIGTLEEYTKQIHQSVAIDSSVNVVFFVPKNNALSGAYLNGENILDVNDYRMINGQNCYVLRVGVAPKDAYTDQQLVLSFGSSSETVTLDASLMHYAKKLFALTEEGANAAYFADSKSLMRYVLYYVRTAAKSLGDATDADLAAIDAYLEGFTLTASDKTISESIYETTAAAGSVDAATLDLQSKVGMVFRVAEGFVGTITASMPGIKDEVHTYTEDTPAPKDEYIILEHIPAHKLCSDVTLTITPSGADTIVLSYNLATYVNGVKTDISYAVYAYAKAAQTYREKYPTASVYAE